MKFFVQDFRLRNDDPQSSVFFDGETSVKQTRKKTSLESPVLRQPNKAYFKRTLNPRYEIQYFQLMNNHSKKINFN